MSETVTCSSRKAYGMFAFWGLHTLMLAFFLILETSGFKMPVGSSLFYFTWIAVWMTHGLTLVLMHVRDREVAEGDWTAESRFWLRLILAAHSSSYVAFGPAVLLWWLMVRTPGPLQPGEGQGFWIYPLWLMVLLAHGAYVMIRERQVIPAKVGQKRKRDLPSLKRLMETDADEIDAWDEDDYGTRQKR